MKYKVLAAEQDAKGFVEVPEDVIMLSGMYHPVTGRFVVACLEPVVEKPKEEKPEEETPGKEE
ncbi:hypothetical protein ES703_101837 [subsurface metagenome]